MKEIRLVAACVLASILAVGSIAARNSGGTYAIPTTGYPFVSGTTVSSSVVNGIFNDLATEMTDSLSRTGKGGMTAPLRTADGTAAAPSFSFTSDTDVGLYRAGANDCRMSVGGAAVQTWTATGTSVTGTLGVSGTSTLAGNLAFSGAGGTVVNQSANQSIWFQVNGSNILTLNGTAIYATKNLDLAGAGGTNVNQSSGQALNFQVGGSNILGIDSTLIYANSHRITQVTDPSAAQDAATKAYVDARFVVAGRVTGATGAIASQTGSVTASCVRNGAGDYTVSVSGLTANAIVTAVNNSYSSYFANPTSIATGQFRVYTVNYQNSAVDSDFSFVVVKL